MSTMKYVYMIVFVNEVTSIIYVTTSTPNEGG